MTHELHSPMADQTPETEPGTQKKVSHNKAGCRTVGLMLSLCVLLACFSYLMRALIVKSGWGWFAAPALSSLGFHVPDYISLYEAFVVTLACMSVGYPFLFTSSILLRTLRDHQNKVITTIEMINPAGKEEKEDDLLKWEKFRKSVTESLSYSVFMYLFLWIMSFFFGAAAWF